MSQLRFLTLNVCFECPDTYSKRFAAIIRHIRTNKYDVICLQECVDDLTMMLRSSLSTEYEISAPPPSPYYTMMLCRKALCPTSFTRKPLPSRMGRDVLFTDLKRSNEALVTFATVHLESENNHPDREKQMEMTNQILESKRNVLLMGDFNFPAHRNYRRVAGERLHNESLRDCLPKYIDSWASFPGKGPGYTFDHGRNHWKFCNVSSAKGGHRFDRVMMKLEDNDRFTLTWLSLTADNSIGVWEGEGGLKGPMYMSDHLGIEGILQDQEAFREVAAQDVASLSKRARPGDDLGNHSGVSKRSNVNAAEEESKLSDSAQSEIDSLNLFLGDEPSETEPRFRIGMTLMDGKRRTRYFYQEAPVEALFWWACVCDPSLIHPRRQKFALRINTSSEELGNNEEVVPLCLKEISNLNMSMLRIVLL